MDEKVRLRMCDNLSKANQNDLELRLMKTRNVARA